MINRHIAIDQRSMAGNRAPSVSLFFDDRESGEILIQDVYVPSSGLTKCTYYCCLQWNGGQDGGGYCGIQDHPDGKVFIFSMWDPNASTKEEIKAVHIGHDTQISRFGGEGTGLKSMNFTIGWKPDQWYTLLVKRWDQEDHSYFGFWVLDRSEQIWRQLTTFDFPLPKIYFRSRTACFVEDWRGTGENTRCAQYKNGFKYSCEKQWIPFRTANFSVNQERPTKCYNENYDGGVQDDCCFHIKTGGSTTKPREGLGSRCRFKVEDKHIMDQPNIPTIEFNVSASSANKIMWTVPECSIPQFSYSVKVDGNEMISKIDTEGRSVDVHMENAEEVEITLTDLFGREVSKKINLQ